MTEPFALVQFRQRLVWKDLDETVLRKLIRLAVKEDLHGAGLKINTPSEGDRTTMAMDVLGKGSAAIVAREPIVVCGLPLLPLILEVFDIVEGFLENVKTDGEEAEAGEILAVIQGSVSALLTAERTLLNFLQRLCGIATTAKAFVNALAGTETNLLDTRKNTPGLRALEKYASATGGFYNHRYGLNDRILIKDNHLAASGSIKGERLAASVNKVKSRASDLLVEVEVDHLDQVSPVVDAGADAILLDNFSPEEVAEAVHKIRNRAVVEASGGITLETARRYAEANPHFLSTSATIQKCSWADLGLDWKED